MNRYNMNKNQLQFTRKNFNKLHLKEIMNDDNLDKLENKEDKILLEKCFQYVYQSKDNLNQKKYKNKLFFILVGYDEVSMETKNTPFGMCSVSIDSTDDNYTKLVIFDLFKTVEGLDSDVFTKIFLKKIHNYYEKHFFVHSTSKKQYLIRELIMYIEPSKKSDTLANALTESNYTSVGKMVNLHKNSNKEFEEFTLPLNVDQLIKQNKNKNNSNSNNSSSNSNKSNPNSNKSNPNSNNGSSNRVENMTTNEIKNKTNNVQMNVSESIGPNITSNNGMMSVNDSIKSDDSNKNLFKEHNMSIEQNTNQQSQQKSTTDTPSTLETIQETGVQMNERLTKTINSGLQSISQFFSGKKEENSSTNKSNGTAMVVSSNSAQMSVNSPQQDKHRNVLVGGAKKKAKKAKKVKKAVKKTIKKKAVKKTTTKKTTAKKAPKKKVKKSKTSKTIKLKAASKKKTLKKKPKHRGLFSILFR